MDQIDNTQTRKRTRDQGEPDDKEAKKGMKKSEFSLLDDLMHQEKSYYDFGDGVGVFDFPWLKEGVIYKGDDYFQEPEDTFAPCDYIDEQVSTTTFTSNLDQSCQQNLLAPPAHDQNKSDDDSTLGPLFRADDDLEPVDCIWSFAMDQPLDVGFNKAKLEI